MALKRTRKLATSNRWFLTNIGLALTLSYKQAPLWLAVRRGRSHGQAIFSAATLLLAVRRASKTSIG
jgi:hypothetical protein